jgi:hypothetical protein
MTTGLQSWKIAKGLYIVPLLFAYTPLLSGEWWQALTVFAFALVAMLTFAAATQRFFIVRCRWYEVAALLLIAFTLFRPGYWMDMIEPELIEVPPTEIASIAEQMPPNSRLRVRVEGETLEGDLVSKAVMLPLGAPGTGEERLFNAGLELRTEDDGRVLIDMVGFASAAERLGLEFDWEITRVLMPNENRPPAQLFFIPALLVLTLLWFDQTRRLRRHGGEPAEVR